MANRAHLVANPTAADVTVNAKTAVSGKNTLLQLDDATNEAYQFTAAGCAVVRNDVGTESQRQQAGYLLHMEEYEA